MKMIDETLPKISFRARKDRKARDRPHHEKKKIETPFIVIGSSGEDSETRVPPLPDLNELRKTAEILPASGELNALNYKRKRDEKMFSIKKRHVSVLKRKEELRKEYENLQGGLFDVSSDSDCIVICSEKILHSQKTSKKDRHGSIVTFNKKLEKDETKFSVKKEKKVKAGIKRLLSDTTFDKPEKKERQKVIRSLSEDFVKIKRKAFALPKVNHEMDNDEEKRRESKEEKCKKEKREGSEEKEKKERRESYDESKENYIKKEDSLKKVTCSGTWSLQSHQRRVLKKCSVVLRKLSESEIKMKGSPSRRHFTDVFHYSDISDDDLPDLNPNFDIRTENYSDISDIDDAESVSSRIAEMPLLEPMKNLSEMDLNFGYIDMPEISSVSPPPMVSSSVKHQIYIPQCIAISSESNDSDSVISIPRSSFLEENVDRDKKRTEDCHGDDLIENHVVITSSSSDVDENSEHNVDSENDDDEDEEEEEEEEDDDGDGDDENDETITESKANKSSKGRNSDKSESDDNIFSKFSSFTFSGSSSAFSKVLPAKSTPISYNRITPKHNVLKSNTSGNIANILSFLMPQHHNMLDACLEEDDSINLMHYLEFLENFTTKFSLPTEVTKSLMKTAFFQPADRVDLVQRSYSLLKLCNNRQNGAIYMDLDLIEDSLSKVYGTEKSSDYTVLLQRTLFLKLSVEILQKDLYNRDLYDTKEIRKSYAYKLLSYDVASSKKRLVYYINQALHAGQTLTARFEGAVKDIPHVLQILQELLALSIDVSISCVDAATGLSEDLVGTYTFLPDIASKEHLLSSVTSPLLQYKLVQTMLETQYDQYLPLSGFPESLQGVVDSFFEVTPLKFQMTPPTTPTDEEPLDDIPGEKSFSPSETEEMAMLLYFLIKSYLQVSIEKLHIPLHRRSRYSRKGSGPRLYDLETIGALDQHVDQLRGHLLSLCPTLSDKAEDYLMLLLCCGD